MCQCLGIFKITATWGCRAEAALRGGLADEDASLSGGSSCCLGLVANERVPCRLYIGGVPKGCSRRGLVMGLVIRGVYGGGGECGRGCASFKTHGHMLPRSNGLNGCMDIVRGVELGDQGLAVGSAVETCRRKTISNFHGVAIECGKAKGRAKNGRIQA